MNENQALPAGTRLQGHSYAYEIERVLGQGSFGITYCARLCLSGELGELASSVTVAVKEFFMKDINGREGTSVTSGSNGGVYSDYKAKFKREAVNLSHMKHPGIVKVLEAFEANNTFYYTMEYIEGGSLDSYIREWGSLPEQEALDCVEHIGSALAFMHAHRMLHLDLKPLNVMRRADGRPVLIDFGLSKQYGGDGQPESSTTIGGGTPGYAPLEQANYHEGRDFPVTLDVYALGATLYKMLTGQTPPVAADVLNDGFPEEPLRQKQVSRKTIEALRKAMSPMKKERWQTVEEFLGALDERTVPNIKRKEPSGGSQQKENIVEPQPKPVVIDPLPAKTVEKVRKKNVNWNIGEKILWFASLITGSVCLLAALIRISRIGMLFPSASIHLFGTVYIPDEVANILPDILCLLGCYFWYKQRKVGVWLILLMALLILCLLPVYTNIDNIILLVVNIALLVLSWRNKNIE